MQALRGMALHCPAVSIRAARALRPARAAMARHRHASSGAAAAGDPPELTSPAGLRFALTAAASPDETTAAEAGTAVRALALRGPGCYRI